MPHWTGGISHFCRSADAPSPKEPILQRIHISQSVTGNAIFPLLRPVLPIFPGLACPCAGRHIGRYSSDTVEPLAAVVDGIGPLAADCNSKGRGRLVGSSSPATSGFNLIVSESSVGKGSLCLR